MDAFENGQRRIVAPSVSFDAGGIRAAPDMDTGDLFALVYEELRQLAGRYLSREGPGQTLQPTALVHEAYLRLSGATSAAFESRAHFFGAAARAIRCILIDRARARRLRRVGEGPDVASLRDEQAEAAGELGLDILDLDAAISRLAALDPHKARVVELRFFGGLTTEETAETLGTSPSSVNREWRFARAWLHRELSGDRL